MLAMFQIPNKFHERDGRVTDSAARTGKPSGATPKTDGIYAGA